MEELNNTFAAMVVEMEAAREDLAKFIKGNKSAGTRVRASMQELKVKGQSIRLGVQAIKNS